MRKLRKNFPKRRIEFMKSDPLAPAVNFVTRQLPSLLRNCSWKIKKLCDMQSFSAVCDTTATINILIKINSHDHIPFDLIQRNDARFNKYFACALNQAATSGTAITLPSSPVHGIRLNFSSLFNACSHEP